MLRKLGSAKYKIVRVFAYIAIVNLAILVQVNGLRWWYLAVPPVFAFLYWFETKYGIPGEQEVGWEGNANFKEMRREIHEIHSIFTTKPMPPPSNPFDNIALTKEVESSHAELMDKVYGYITLSTDQLRQRTHVLK